MWYSGFVWIQTAYKHNREIPFSAGRFHPPVIGWCTADTRYRSSLWTNVMNSTFSSKVAWNAENYCLLPWSLLNETVSCFVNADKLLNPCFSGSHVLSSKDFPIHKDRAKDMWRMCSASTTYSELQPQSRHFLQLQLTQRCPLGNSGKSWWCKTTKSCTRPNPWALSLLHKYWTVSTVAMQ